MHNDPKNEGRIKVGDIVNSVAVAIGDGAQAVVNYVLPNLEELRGQHERAAMLAKVNAMWVEGYLANSLHPGTLIPVGLVERAEAVDNQPWADTVQMPAGQQPSLTPSATIGEAFYGLNTLDRTLLILGAPGSGKTTLLLDLARTAISRAQRDLVEPIPVVLHLVSWGVKRPPLAEWIGNELSEKYNTSRETAKQWLENRQLLLLLDGLDEVQADCQDDCVQAINVFCEASSKTPMVVCCRVDEYAALPVRLKFQRAVLIHSLTPQQVDDYLQAAQGDQSATVAAFLAQDAALQELAQNPLMLNTMLLAYEGVSLAQLQALHAAGDQRHNLFVLYVERMFQRGSPKHPYPQTQTKRWLAWLARQLVQHAQVIFLIERIQPSWLADGRVRWAYVLISRLVLSLIGGLIGGPLIGLGLALFGGSTLERALARGVIEGVLSCLIAGVVVGLIDLARMEQDHRQVDTLRSRTNWQLALNILVVSVCVFLAVWWGIGVVLGSRQWLGMPASFWWGEGQSVGMLVGLCFGLVFGFGTRGGRQVLREDVQTVENLSWSPVGGIVGAVYGALAGLVSGLFVALTIRNSAAEFLPIAFLYGGLKILLVSIPFLALGGAIFGGLRGGIIPNSTAPNQGIRLSMTNAAIIGGGIGLFFGVLGALVGQLTWGGFAILVLGVYGLFFGLVAALSFGGVDVIKHGILRWLLRRSGDAPLNYARFLAYAADRILLYKVGGGYIFVHRTLLEYFAELKREA